MTPSVLNGTTYAVNIYMINPDVQVRHLQFRNESRALWVPCPLEQSHPIQWRNLAQDISLLLCPPGFPWTPSSSPTPPIHGHPRGELHRGITSSHRSSNRLFYTADVPLGAGVSQCGHTTLQWPWCPEAWDSSVMLESHF